MTGISLVTALQFCIRGLTQRAAFVSPATSSDLKLSCDFAVILPMEGPQLDEGVGPFLGFDFRL